MSNVRLKEIADIQAGPFGTQLHKSEYVDQGILMLNAKNIGNGVILTDSVDYVSVSVCKRLPTYILKEGDILFGRAGSIDKHAYVNSDFSGCFQGTNCIRIRCRDMNISKYISYYLWKSDIKKRIENNTGGSILSYISSDLLKEIVVNIPDDRIIKSSVGLLSLIDNKIANNNKINETLQQQAHDIYMHLFFRKATNGKIADILLENEKSIIQVGEAKAAIGNYPFFTSGEAILEWEECLVGGRNAFLNTGGNADVKFYVGEAAYSTDTWCITAKNALSDYLFLLLNSIKVELNQKFFQGTGLKHLQKGLLKDRPIYIPDEKETNAFNKTICPMLDMISEKTRETQELTRLRDWLLPMLMNGQATVAEEQKPVLQVIENDTKNEQPDRFALWLQNQGLAARGDIDRQTLREIFDAMDDDDK